MNDKVAIGLLGLSVDGKRWRGWHPPVAVQLPFYSQQPSIMPPAPHDINAASALGIWGSGKTIAHLLYIIIVLGLEVHAAFRWVSSRSLGFRHVRLRRTDRIVAHAGETASLSLR
jgi:hypothetical protein